MLAGLQSSFRFVCDLFDKVSGVGGWAFDVVEECVCFFDHRVCAPRNKSLPVAK